MSSVEPKSNTRQRSDAELVRMAQDGDSDAFAALFHQHRARIYSLCLRLTSNPAEAEDLTQDAFVQVFRKLATFRGDSALSTWLYRVAYNTVLMHFRKHSVRQMSLDEPADSGRGSAIRERGKMDEQLSGSIDRLALIRAMEKLPIRLTSGADDQQTQAAKATGTNATTGRSEATAARRASRTPPRSYRP